METTTQVKIPATLYLLCGKMAAGKSTLARQLASQQQALLLSEDEFLATLYPGEITDIPAYVNRSGRLKSAIESLVVQILTRGTSVVMDFPANTASQRAWLVSLARSANTPHSLYFIDLPDSTCKAQLRKRSAETPHRATTDTVEMFDAITRYFEAPEESEGLNITRIESVNC